MVTLNRRNLLRFNAVPTEVQMKLGISQVLSLPFAYNAPVIVLDFEVGNKNIIKGRFKDASRPRVFEFEIGDSVSFKPFTWKRTDSDVDPMAWEDFSKGYTYRYDAVKKVRKEKPKCGNTSYNCGKACIGLNKNCKSDPPDKPSQEKIDKVRAMGGEFKQTKSDPTKAQENNKLTPKPPEEVIEPYNRNNAPSNIAKKKVAIKRALRRLGVEVSNDETIEGLESKISKASGFKFSDQEDIYELIKRLQSVGTTDNPMVEPGLVSELKPVQEVKVTGISIDKSFHVRDTLIDKDKFNQLPEDQRKAILELTDQFNKLGYIDARTQIGPSQSARQSQNSRDKIAQTAAKAFQIEARIKSLLRTPEEQAIDKASSELSKLRGELDHARNEMRTMQVLASHKLNSKRDNSVKRYKQKLLLREEELNNLITEKELQIKALKNPLQQKQTPQSQPKSTPNSSGESGKAIAVSTPDKKVEQKYKDIIASSKDPKGTEKVLREAMVGGALWKSQKQTYKESLEEIEGGIVPEGYENHVQGIVDRYKPVIDAENFINKRREAVAKGDFRTKEEAELYVGKKIQSKSNKPYDYFDSPEYGKEYEKIKSVMKSDKLPPPLSGVVPSKELKQTIKQGDQLLYKKDAYSLGVNSLSGYEISDAGEVIDIGFKNVKTRSNSEYMGRLYENEGTVPLDKISHIIRDGKRYKVDPSDSSPNDLGIPEAKTVKGAKGAIAKSEPKPKTKQKTLKIPKPKVVDPLLLTPEPQKTPEPIAKTPKLIGDGTHEGMPKNAQEYYDMVTKSGRKITKEEAEGTIKAIEKWGLDSTHVRDVQKAGKSSKEEQYITDFINNSTPYKGELYRGLSIYMDDPRDLIKVGQPLGNQGAHASWTSKPQVAEHFAGMSDDYHYSVVIKSINNKTGASIRKITEEWQGGFMGMEEVIVPKNAKHIVRSIEERKDGVYFVVVEEI